MAPPIDVLALAEALEADARKRLEAATKRHDGTRIGALQAWRAADRDWCRALDLSRELQAAHAA